MNKYYIYLINKNSNKKVFSSNSKKEVVSEFKIYIKKYSKKISKYPSNCILLKIQKVKYNENQPIKMVHGPIKVTISFLTITSRLSIKPIDDKRETYLFLTPEFLEKFKLPMIIKYFKKIVEYAYLNKLEKRLLSPKTINQIKL
jgi:hypothetical protein